jgi:hypothetical protein
MRNLFTLISLMTLVSCQTENKKITVDKTRMTDLVFEMGSKTHYTDTCAFYFECDCCSGDLILNADSSFLEVDNCMSNRTLLFGEFEFEKDSLRLNYSGKVKRSEYNYENEFDTSAVDYFISDTSTSPFSHSYLIGECNGKIKLISKDEKNLGIESTRLKKETVILNLKNDGLY